MSYPGHSGFSSPTPLPSLTHLRYFTLPCPCLSSPCPPPLALEKHARNDSTALPHAGDSPLPTPSSRPVSFAQTGLYIQYCRSRDLSQRPPALATCGKYHFGTSQQEPQPSSSVLRNDGMERHVRAVQTSRHQQAVHEAICLTVGNDARGCCPTFL